MKISAFSQLTGLSAYPLRYYEKIGLLSVSKDSSGHRQYTQKDVDWVNFINRLRETAMPLKHIKQYAQWRAQGQSTAMQRRALLQQHAEHLQQVIINEQQHLQALKTKIAFYENNSLT